jgi:tripeptidyl-peptidase-2
VEYALRHTGKLGQDLEFGVTVPSRGNARGIYLRDVAELSGPLTIGVEVKPLFAHAASPSSLELAEALSFELPVQLSSTAEWLVVPPSMVLLSAKERGAQNFAVRIEPGNLVPGAHFARVVAKDASDPSRGPLFSLPVTVVIPHAVIAAPLAPTSEETAPVLKLAPVLAQPQVAPERFDLCLRAGEPVRRFISVPDAAEWATVELVTGRLPAGPHIITVHAVPSARGDLPSDICETKQMLRLRDHAKVELRMPVRGGATLELCVQLAWLPNPAPA